MMEQSRAVLFHCPANWGFLHNAPKRFIPEFAFHLERRTPEGRRPLANGSGDEAEPDFAR